MVDLGSENNELNAIRDSISAARMAEDVKALIKFAPRHAATENEWKAAGYV